MSFCQNTLRLLSQPLLSRNKKFLGSHDGEECYIFGSGSSIKSFDLKKLPDRFSIGINFFCLHKDYPELNVKYHVIPQPYFFYPFFKTVKRQYIRNTMAAIFREFLRNNPETNVFTSLSNLFGLYGKNVFYVHHFGHRVPDRNYRDVSGINSYIHAGLGAAISIAIYLGFKKAYLVGCDYLLNPVKHFHFYSYGSGIEEYKSRCTYERLLEQSADYIDLELITDSGTSPWLPSSTYPDITGVPLKYQENTDLVLPGNLAQMHKAYMANQFSNPIFPA